MFRVCDQFVRRVVALVGALVLGLVVWLSARRPGGDFELAMVSHQPKGIRMSHTAVVEFPCNPGQGAALLETLRAALVDTRAFDGNEAIEVYSSQEDPDTVLLWEKWAAKANYDAYLAWRMETGLMDVLAPFMDTSKLRIVNLDAHPDV